MKKPGTENEALREALLDLERIRIQDDDDFLPV